MEVCHGAKCRWRDFSKHQLPTNKINRASPLKTKTSTPRMAHIESENVRINSSLHAWTKVRWTHTLLQYNIWRRRKILHWVHSVLFIHSFVYSRFLTWFQFIEQVYDVHWMQIRIIISFPFILITVVDAEVLHTYPCAFVYSTCICIFKKKKKTKRIQMQAHYMHVCVRRTCEHYAKVIKKIKASL